MYVSSASTQHSHQAKGRLAASCVKMWEERSAERNLYPFTSRLAPLDGGGRDPCVCECARADYSLGGALLGRAAKRWDLRSVRADASLQLQLGQINNPLLKMSRLGSGTEATRAPNVIPQEGDVRGAFGSLRRFYFYALSCVMLELINLRSLTSTV